MIPGGPRASFGPYAFRLTNSEAEAAAARLGTRAALKGGCAVFAAPFLIFALVVAIAFILAFFGIISRRTGKTALFVAAVVFVAERILSHWLVWRAHAYGRRAALVRLQGGGEFLAEIDADGVSVSADGGRVRTRYADCAEVEDMGELIYVWRRQGDPILLPKRALPEGEAALVLGAIRQGLAHAKGGPSSRMSAR